MKDKIILYKITWSAAGVHSVDFLGLNGGISGNFGGDGVICGLWIWDCSWLWCEFFLNGGISGINIGCDAILDSFGDLILFFFYPKVNYSKSSLFLENFKKIKFERVLKKNSKTKKIAFSFKITFKENIHNTQINWIKNLISYPEKACFFMNEFWTECPLNGGIS